CCACAAPAMAIERAMAPPESQLLSLLIGMSPPRSQRCLHSGFGASIEVVAPAQAGAQFFVATWIPAFAGMTTVRSFRRHRHLDPIPVQDLLAGPVQNPGLAQHVTI